MNRLLMFRIIDCITLCIITLMGISLGSLEIEFLVVLGLPSLLLLYSSWKGDSAYIRISAFSALVFIWSYQYQYLFEELFTLIVVAIFIGIFFRPPIHFLRTTVYSSWGVALYLLWKKLHFDLSGWQSELLMVFFNIGSYLPYILLLGFFLGLVLTFVEKSYNSQNLYVVVMAIAGAFVLVPFYLLLGVIRGLYESFYDYWITFLMKFKVQPKLVGTKMEHYLASAAIENWKSIWSGSFKSNRYTVSVWKQDVKDYFRRYGFFLACYYSLLKQIGIVTLTIIAPLVNVVFSVVHYILLVFCLFVYQVLRIGFYYLDALYRKFHKVEMVCPTCYHQDEIPAYVCSHCQTVHDDLMPNHFGIFKRKCTCGNSLPTSILNGRSELKAECPKCHSAYEGKESTPIIIPMIGGKMAGKTSFLTKGIEQLYQSTLVENDISFHWGSVVQAINFEDLSKKVNAKQAPPKTDAMLPRAWTMRLNQKKWARPKLVTLFDPAGEVFNRTDYMKKLEYLSYSDGFILVVDSTSLLGADVSFNYEQQNTATISPEELIDRLLLYYQEEQGIKVHETIGTPLAIVFHKAEKGNYEQTAHEVSATREFGKGRHEDCKQWLQANGYHNLLRKLDHQFTSYRFFTSSSFDDTKGVAPENVIRWILNSSNKGFKLVEKKEG
ncbi:TRAFAC clade GTPase domain-containing protein [Litchfieldia alkalitelluris]|uniref:TRAFAC clade GTPase domain-containing protein n=1 Tax=Litchfieldia alkalitelluris TaxID=304268 RepID=UPI000997D738|nr:hypothetical protein [Litchfieldia alkalitelluris]